MLALPLFLLQYKWIALVKIGFTSTLNCLSPYEVADRNAGFVMKACLYFHKPNVPICKSYETRFKKKKKLSINTCRRTPKQSFINLVIILFEIDLP